MLQHTLNLVRCDILEAIASWLAHEREKGYPAFDREDIPIQSYL